MCFYLSLLVILVATKVVCRCNPMYSAINAHEEDAAALLVCVIVVQYMYLVIRALKQGKYCRNTTAAVLWQLCTKELCVFFM